MCCYFRVGGGNVDEDEFYECEVDSDTKTSEEKEFRHEPWNQPNGRLRQCDNLTLLHSDEPLYIPITQVRKKKEDML